MNVRPVRILLCAVMTAALCACAKSEAESDSLAKKRAFDAWMYVHHPELKPLGYGIYILDDKPGDGKEVADSNYLFLEYEQRSLEDSAIISYTSPETAKQIGKYNPADNYDPSILMLARGVLSQGVLDAISGCGPYPRMRIGGERTIIVPGWLTSTTQYYDSGKAEDYFNNVSGDNMLYKILIVGQTKDITQWQIDRIEEYMHSHNLPVEDTTGHKGLYYVRNTLREKERGVTVDVTRKFPADTVIYINYIGRLLSGKVFDTNIEDTAKVWGIYSSKSTYKPSAVTWSADSTAISMGGGAVIKGFARTLWRMHPYESGTGLFTSDWGYGTNGSGSKIGPCSPLIFEIDIVDKDED